MADSSSQVTITLPAPSALAVGDIIQVNGVGSGGWTIAQNAGQSIVIQSIPGSAPGESTSGNISGGQYSAIELQYIGANTFTILNYMGNLGDNAAPLSAGYVSEGVLTWMPISSTTYTWAAANTYCTTTTINGQTGWRLPTQAELSAFDTYLALPEQSALIGQGWTLNYTWSSTSAGGGSYYVVSLNYGYVYTTLGATSLYVTCVR
jgi:hypothetical protein